MLGIRACQSIAVVTLAMTSGGHLTVVEMILFSAIISFIGGIASALRTRHEKVKRDVLLLLEYGLNLSVLGTCIAMMCSFWVAGDPKKSWAVVGVCGIVSLGGLASIDWALGLVKSRFAKEVRKDERGKK